MELKDVISWYSDQLSVKKIKVESLKDLKSGSLFLETLHLTYPKYVDLTKIYLKPKNSFEVLQNYKQLMNIFAQLGWKKLDPERYVKQQDKDCFDIASLIIKRVGKELRGKQKNISVLYGKQKDSLDRTFEKVNFVDTSLYQLQGHVREKRVISLKFYRLALKKIQKEYILPHSKAKAPEQNHNYPSRRKLGVRFKITSSEFRPFINQCINISIPHLSILKIMITRSRYSVLAHFIVVLHYFYYLFNQHLKLLLRYPPIPVFIQFAENV